MSKNQERDEKLRKIRELIKNLSDSEREALISKLGIITIEGRSLSPYNQMMLYYQSIMLNQNITVVGGFQQWKKAGKSVCKGQKGMMILYPVGPKDKETGTIENAERFFVSYVFDISQTEELETKEKKPLDAVSG